LIALTYCAAPKWLRRPSEIDGNRLEDGASKEKLVPRMAGFGAGPSDNELKRINSPKASKTKVTRLGEAFGEARAARRRLA